jgi:predicted small secreted protein
VDLSCRAGVIRLTVTEERLMSKEKVLSLAVALGLMAGMAGCNTVEGVGKDVEGAGDAVQDASKDVKKEIKKEKND